MTIPDEPAQTEPRGRTADWPRADPADPLPRLPHPGRRPRATPTPPRSASWRRPSSARRARFTRRSCSTSRRSSCCRPRPSRSATPACSPSWPASATPKDLAEVRKQIEAALAEAALESDRRELGSTPSRSHLRYAFAGSLDNADAVAHGRRRVDRHDRTSRRDERPLRRLRPPDPGRPPARRRALLRARPTRPS